MSNARAAILQAADSHNWDLVTAIAGENQANDKNCESYGEALMLAIVHCAMGSIETLLKAGAPLTHQDATGGNYLHHAILSDSNIYNSHRKRIVELLLEYDVDPTHQDKDGRTPIELAAEKKYWHVVELIAKTKKADKDDMVHYSSALLRAVHQQRKKTVELLLEAGACKTAKYTESENYCLHEAAVKNDQDNIKLLIKHDHDLTQQNKDGKTPIELAAEKGHWDIVKLIAKTKKTDAEDEAGYYEALLAAIKDQRVEVVRALLVAGTPVNKASEEPTNSCLHEAVLTNNKELVELLLKHDADLAAQNKDDETPIVLAAEKDYWGIVELIAKRKKASENDKGNYGSALLDAVAAEQVDAVRALCQSGASKTWHKEKSGSRCLHLAAKKNNQEILKILLEAGHDLTEQNKDGKTPIELAAENGHWDIVKLIAETKKTDVNDAAHYAQALTLAAKAEKADIVTALLKSGAPLSAFDGVTPQEKGRLLLAAIEAENAYLVEQLIQVDLDLTVTNANDKTPIQLAHEKGMWDVVDLIATNKKADKEDNARYKSALLRAVESDRLETVKLLLAAGAGKLWRFNSTQNACLHTAVINNNPEIIKLLLAYDHDLAQKNKDGKTPMLLAAEKGYWDVVKAIAEAKNSFKGSAYGYGDALILAIKAQRIDVVKALLKADALCAIYSGNKTCLHEAVLVNNPEMLRLLLDHGADIKQTNQNNLTALELACHNGYWECAELLSQDPSFKFNNNNGGQAFNAAVKAGQLELASYLKHAGAPTTNHYNSHSALCEAVSSGNVQAVHFVVGNRAFDVNYLPGAHGSVDVLHTLTSSLHAVLAEDEFNLSQMSNLFFKICEYQKHAVKQDIDSLRERREALQRQQHTEQNAQAIENMTKVLHYLNAFHKNPQKQFAVHEVKQINQLAYLSGLLAAKRLFAFVDQQAVRRRYINTLRQELDRLNDQINEGEWRVKALGVWMRGIPETMKKIRHEIGKLTSYSHDATVISRYQTVLNMLSEQYHKHHTSRHQSVRDFYDNVKETLEEVVTTAKTSVPSMHEVGLPHVTKLPPAYSDAIARQREKKAAADAVTMPERLVAYDDQAAPPMVATANMYPDAQQMQREIQEIHATADSTHAALYASMMSKTALPIQQANASVTPYAVAVAAPVAEKSPVVEAAVGITKPEPVAAVQQQQKPATPPPVKQEKEQSAPAPAKLQRTRSLNSLFPAAPSHVPEAPPAQPQRREQEKKAERSAVLA